MKTTNLLGRSVATIMAFLFSFAAIAQEKIDVNITKDGGGSGGGWYTQPWVWIVGAAVFILLLVALLRGNNARD